MEVGGNMYYQYKHHDILWDWDNVSFWGIQSTRDHEICGYNNFFYEIWHMLLRVRVC